MDNIDKTQIELFYFYYSDFTENTQARYLISYLCRREIAHPAARNNPFLQSRSVTDKLTASAPISTLNSAVSKVLPDRETHHQDSYS